MNGVELTPPCLIPINNASTKIAGYNEDGDYLLPISTERKVLIESLEEDGIYHVTDYGNEGALINGSYFEKRSLVIGDVLTFGEFKLLYTGEEFEVSAPETGLRLEAFGLCVDASGKQLLEDISFVAESGTFVGILGSSGAGKTTLLKVLARRIRQSKGDVYYDGIAVGINESVSPLIGFVPQDDVFHHELTCRQVLTFHIRLFHDQKVGRGQADTLVDSVARRLGLAENLSTRVSNLSGGQKRRLSIALELIRKPRVLFLDEPTSGLDPEVEDSIMRVLQRISLEGCTVIATTHLIENVYLMNSIEVLAVAEDDNKTPTFGVTVFRGRPAEARETFGVSHLREIYSKIREKGVNFWAERFSRQSTPATPVAETSPFRRNKTRKIASLRILADRFWSIFFAEKRNVVIALLQPVFIAVIIGLIGTHAEDLELSNKSFIKLFAAYISCLWLGASSGANAIVNEYPIVRNEYLKGLSATGYIFSKLMCLMHLNLLQVICIYAIVTTLFGGVEGVDILQLSCLCTTGMVGVSLGVMISSFAKSSLQAAMLVPMVIIPQILLSGAVVSIKDWNHSPVPRLVCRVMPSFASQRIMDASLFYGRKISLDHGFEMAIDNLETTIYPAKALLHPEKSFEYKKDMSKVFEAVNQRAPFGEETLEWDLKRPPDFYRRNALYIDNYAIKYGFFSHLGWCLVCFIFSCAFLKKSTRIRSI